MILFRNKRNAKLDLLNIGEKLEFVKEYCC